MSAKVFHIPFILLTPQFKLHSIVQRSPKEGNSAPADYPDLKHYNNYKDLLADSEVDVIIVTTPPDNHFELTKAALEAGKHVLTEKPFVPTAAEAEKLIEIAKEQNRLICVYQNRRWDSDFLTVKHLVSEGTLGRIVEFNTHFDRYRADAPVNWKGQLDVSKGGSAIFDLGTHLIDQVYTLFGLPQVVHGRLLNQRIGRMEYENPDGISAEFTYPDGMLVHIRISVMSAEPVQPRFWIRGSKGSFHKFQLDPQEKQLLNGMKPTDAGFGKDRPEDMKLYLVGDAGKIEEQKVPQLEPETYTKLYHGFAKALETNEAEYVPVKPTEARDVLRIIEAVMESAKSGKDISLN